MTSASERDLEQAIEGVIEAATRGCDEVEPPLEELTRMLRRPLPEETSRRILTHLRRHRCYAAMAQLTDTLESVGDEDPQVRRQHAQALIELGQLGVAMGLLEAVAAELPERERRERSEIYGLIGRVHKQRFVAWSDDADAAAVHLRKAIDTYATCYPLDPAWHGANMVALTHRAEREGISLGDRPSSRQLAERLIADLERVPPGNWTPWTHASVGEAALALERWELARNEFGAFARHPDVDHFALAGTTRQLREIWRLEPHAGDPGGEIVAAVETALVATGRGGALDSTPQHLAELSDTLRSVDLAAGGAFEAILGANATVPVEAVLRLLDTAGSVCQIVDRHLQAQNRPSGGTGFLVDGGRLHPDWAGKALAVTNNHVLSIDGRSPSVRHVDADAVFHLLDRTQRVTFRVDKLLAASPRDELDFAVASLADGPGVERALPGFSEDPGALGPYDSKPPHRVYVVGHPQGRGIELSLSDNEVLDHQLGEPPPRPPTCRRIHYAAPTEHGMSGSPVLDAKRFDVLGVHRRGKMPPLRAPARPGYQANEAVWGKSIVDAIRAIPNLPRP